MATRINITTTDPPAPMRWTVDDYHRAIDAGLFDDRRVELVDGEIYEMPPMREPHIGAALYLERTFAPLLATNRLLIDKPIILPQDGEPEPDIAVDVLEHRSSRRLTTCSCSSRSATPLVASTEA